MNGKRILLVDRNKHWLDGAGKALRKKGNIVFTTTKYSNVAVGIFVNSKKPDLIILSCHSIGVDEKALIETLVKRRLQLIVLSSLLHWRELRPLFLVGVADVAEKPFTSSELLTIVDEAFKNLSLKNVLDEKRAEGYAQSWSHTIC